VRDKTALCCGHSFDAQAKLPYERVGSDPPRAIGSQALDE
jgi:hypothetical protein